MNTLGSITVANVVGGTGSFQIFYYCNNFGSVSDTKSTYVATTNEDFTLQLSGVLEFTPLHCRCKWFVCGFE
jgi:hypothetical protein